MSNLIFPILQLVFHLICASGKLICSTFGLYRFCRIQLSIIFMVSICFPVCCHWSKFQLQFKLFVNYQFITKYFSRQITYIRVELVREEKNQAVLAWRKHINCPRVDTLESLHKSILVFSKCILFQVEPWLVVLVLVVLWEALSLPLALRAQSRHVLSSNTVTCVCKIETVEEDIWQLFSVHMPNNNLVQLTAIKRPC